MQSVSTDGVKGEHNGMLAVTTTPQLLLLKSALAAKQIC